MSTRNTVLAATLAASLAGCVDRGDWKPAPRLEPQALSAQQTLAGARLDAAAWPPDLWWHGYGDPQLDALIDESLAGSPSLEIAQARLRAAQAQATSAQGARQPTTTLNGEVNRQKYPQNGLVPPPYAGSYVTEARLALDFSYDIDFWARRCFIWTRWLAKVKRRAKINPMPMQPGDVASTEADVEETRSALGYAPSTSIEVGVGKFVDWYLDYYSQKS